MMKKIIIAITLIVILTIVAIGFNNQKPEQITDNQTNNVINDEINNENEIGTAPVNNLAIGLYEKYSGDLSQYENKNIVLFFKANWCPSCRALDSDIKNSLNDIPENVVLLELNYDTETELKKKYGITTQHTLVQVDKDGNMIKKWSGGSKLEDVLNQIN